MPQKPATSKSGVEFFPGQEEAAGQVFGDFDIIGQILGGRPLPADERATSRGLELLQRRSARAGTRGSGVAARKEAEFVERSATATADASLDRLLRFIQPPGTSSVSVGGQASLLRQSAGKA